jgi:hypothetical protein
MPTKPTRELIALRRLYEAVAEFGSEWRRCGDPPPVSGRCGECAGCYLDAMFTAARLVRGA